MKSGFAVWVFLNLALAQSHALTCYSCVSSTPSTTTAPAGGSTTTTTPAGGSTTTTAPAGGSTTTTAQAGGSTTPTIPTTTTTLPSASGSTPTTTQSRNLRLARAANEDVPVTTGCLDTMDKKLVSPVTCPAEFTVCTKVKTENSQGLFVERGCGSSKSNIQGSDCYVTESDGTTTTECHCTSDECNGSHVTLSSGVLLMAAYTTTRLLWR